MVTTSEMANYLTWTSARLDSVCEFIRNLVILESPSDSPEHVDKAAGFLARATADIASARTFEADGYGRHLLLDFQLPGEAEQGKLLALGHLDTVWPVGTLKRMPYREADGRLWGPGVLDMKAGIAMFVFAMRLLRESGVPLRKRVSLLVVSDEEVGSPSSRAITEAEATKSDAVLVLEPGTGLTGRLKTARKGIANYRINISGQAAHAGVDFEQGASAVLEAARLIQRCAALTDVEQGITVNPGVVRGGTRSNVIAAEAEIQVDARALRVKDLCKVDEQIKALTPFDQRCRVQVEGGINRPPMERTAAIARLFESARAAAVELGFAVEESSTGGGSDGNFTAALGVPTLDGLGAVGEGAHATHESILIEKIPERVALLAALVRDLAG